MSSSSQDTKQCDDNRFRDKSGYIYYGHGLGMAILFFNTLPSWYAGEHATSRRREKALILVHSGGLSYHQLIGTLMIGIGILVS